MNMKFAAAIVLLAAVPALAQAQQGGNAPKPTKADVQKLVQSIQSDKAKTQKYCDMMKLYDQAAEAEEKKDSKKVEDLTKQADEAGKGLGGDYEKVMAGLQQIDPSSAEGQELSAVLDPLDNACGGDAPKK
jgi:ABC-type transporter Mla subunit MlaD